MEDISIKENAILGDKQLQRGLISIHLGWGDFCIRSSSEVWGKSHIDQKIKIFIAIAIDIAEGITGKPFQNHIKMAIKQGVTQDELEELGLFMSIYAGFNKTGIYMVELKKALSEVVK